MATEKIITENLPVRLRGFSVPNYVQIDTDGNGESTVALGNLPADVLDRTANPAARPRMFAALESIYRMAHEGEAYAR